MRPEPTARPSLSELDTTIVVCVSNALSTSHLLSAAAPFSDPMIALVEADLERALEAAHAIRDLHNELIRQIGCDGDGLRGVR